MNELILLGASTRAAAMSARRAGWTPWCADLFADADLERMATVRRIPHDRYPDSLLDVLRDAPDGPVMYTGALENRPDLIAKIDRPLWGNPPSVLRAVRDPVEWTRRLCADGVSCPAVSDRPTPGRWLLKPRNSAGGFGIRPYQGKAFNPHTHFLQQWIDGEPLSAVFLGLGENQFVTCLGISRQLIGTPWLNARGFQYAGNIYDAPVKSLPAALRWHDLGIALMQFGLRGLFGVDVIARDDEVWPVEINPRYTSSMELLERRWHDSLLRLHGGAFEGAPAPFFSMPQGPAWAKGILYARKTFAFPESGPWRASLAEDADVDEVEYADIPHAGEMIKAGEPVLTVFASGESISECETSLREKAQALDRRLWG